MTDEEIVKTVADALRGPEDLHLELKTIWKIGPGSNIWKVLCAIAGTEAEFKLYVFPDATTEQLAVQTRERLSFHLPRWHSSQPA